MQVKPISMQVEPISMQVKPISMQSACNQHAISMQSACSQHAVGMQSDVHLRLEAHIEHPIGLVEHEDLASS
jgi:hypothetical protein